MLPSWRLIISVSTTSTNRAWSAGATCSAARRRSRGSFVHSRADQRRNQLGDQRPVPQAERVWLPLGLAHWFSSITRRFLETFSILQPPAFRICPACIDPNLVVICLKSGK
jgi:hypothetical protein